MEPYIIHQLVYTKLNQEDSPFGKKDFHTAFYPLNFLTTTDVMVIENHIFIPTISEFSSKQVVYFQIIKNETYLFVFDINILPNEVDSLGRGGIFICHVFMFPKSLWQKIPSPNKLMELVQGYKYKSRSELLNSNYIDKKTGNIKPVQIEQENMQLRDTHIPPLDGIFEVQLLLNLIDTLKKENKEQKFIVSAQETKVRELFNKLLCYVPNQHKANIGWDTMFDGGRMMDYNKTFLAYQEKAPKGGSSSTLVHLADCKIDLATDFKTTKEQDPFAKWLAGCYSSIENYFFVEEAYKLSETLLSSQTYDLKDDWNVECFAKANNELIEKLFLKKFRNEFKGRLAKELNKIISSKDKLFYYNDKLDFSVLANYILTIIEFSKISARHFKKGIPLKYINYSPTLILIDQLWRDNKFNLEMYSHLSGNQKLQLNKYVIKTLFFKSAWYLDFIKHDETLLNYYIKQYSKPKKIIRRFRRVLKMNEPEINQTGFSLSIIRKVFYFRMAHFFNRILRIFRKKKR